MTRQANRWTADSRRTGRDAKKDMNGRKGAALDRSGQADGGARGWLVLACGAWRVADSAAAWTHET
jgi:hypothetical protein